MKTKLLLLSVMFCATSIAQNLVRNPSFEDYNVCPTYQGNLTNANFWSRPLNHFGSPDYFNECSTTQFTDVPTNFYGSQSAFDGVAYAGFAAGENASQESYSEYIEAFLQTPLVPGQDYMVTFMVSFAENSKYALKNIGLYFSNNGLEVPYNSTAAANLVPQIKYPQFITNSTGWTEITGIYHAELAYRYLTIGRFLNNDSNDSDFLLVNNSASNAGALYYVDMVSVTSIPLSTKENRISEFRIYPNPVNDILNINFKGSEIKSIEIYNVLGQMVLVVTNAENTKNIDVSNLKSGSYFVKVKSDSGNSVAKFIKK